MAGFHPAARRSIGRRAQDDAATNDQQQQNNDNTKNDEDEIESDFSSDYDQPYHETASNWHNRHARRRARRLAGISSSSSSDSSDDSCSSLESEDDDHNNSQGGDRENKEMEKAVRSARRPLEKWLASYPAVAARCCCLSSIPSATDTNNATQFNNYNYSPGPSLQLQTREQECRKLRRIFRRLRRKQSEFRVKYMNTSSTEQQNNSTSNNFPNALPLEQLTSVETEEGDQLAMHSFLPQGTGISFIDAALTRDSTLLHSKSMTDVADSTQKQTLSRLVLELNGPPRSGMTSILLAMAARYVASTSNLFLGSEFTAGDRQCNDSFTVPADASEEGHRPTKRCRQSNSVTAATEPRVVILDLEKGVHAVKLILSVREAVLRRWGETAAARQWKMMQEKLWRIDGSSDAYGDESNNTMDEQRQIELAIASCLGRIHVVQPRDFTYLSLVATVEVLRQSLDKERVVQTHPMADSKRQRPSQQFGRPTRNVKHSSANQEPPTLILIDSLTTLDASTRFQESLPATASGSNRTGSGSSGLSDVNEFYRQLIRLREEHEVAILGASRFTPSVNRSNNDQSASRTSLGGSKRGGSSMLWEKMVSHRITLHHVAEGTAEDRAGYDFVATLNANGTGEGASVFPYSITAGGIDAKQ